jgi:hypothetical protein
MANNFGNTNYTLWADTALEQLGYELPFINSYATDISNIEVPTAVSSSVIVKTYATAGTALFNGTFSSNNISTNDSTVTLDKFRYAQRTLSAAELMSQDVSVRLVEIGKEIGQSLAQDVTSDFTNVFTLGNYTNYTIVNSASFARNVLNSVGATLSKRGVIASGRAVMLNNDYYNYLGNDQSYVSAIALNPAFTNTILTGNLPHIAGFTPSQISNPLLPQSNYSGSYKVVGVAQHKSGVAFASRTTGVMPEMFAGAGVQTIVSSNNKLGLVVTSQMIPDPVNTGGLILRSSILYGVTPGNTAATQVLIG